MRNKLSFAIFWVRYQIVMALSGIRKKHATNYLVILQGRYYPTNVKQVIKPLLAAGLEFRYSIGASTISLMFHSHKTLNQVNEHLNMGFEGLVDNIFVYRRGRGMDKIYAVNMNIDMFRNLFGKQPEVQQNLTSFQKLDQLQNAINLLLKQRIQYGNFLAAITKPLDDEDETESFPRSTTPNPKEVLDVILNKINEKGINSLTEEEKETLKKLSK